MESDETEVIIIGYHLPAGVDTFKVPQREGRKAVSFQRCAFGVSIIYERIKGNEYRR